jgi:hypothetical protein
MDKRSNKEPTNLTPTPFTMFKFIAILASLVSASAFAPASRMAPASALKMSFEDALGAQAPLGFWDPLGVLEYCDEERFDRLRYVEVRYKEPINKILFINLSN